MDQNQYEKYKSEQHPRVMFSSKSKIFSQLKFNPKILSELRVRLTYYIILGK